MKTLIFLCIVMMGLCCVCGGAVILDDGLVLQGGEEFIEMQVGEKVYLRVQDSIWKYPVLHNLEFSSKKPWVAYVDTYQWIHSGLPGRTVISVWDDEGANGTIEVIVRGRSKAPLWVILTVFVLFLCALTAFFGQKPSRFFN